MLEIFLKSGYKCHHIRSWSEISEGKGELRISYEGCGWLAKFRFPKKNWTKREERSHENCFSGPPPQKRKKNREICLLPFTLTRYDSRYTATPRRNTALQTNLRWRRLLRRWRCDEEFRESSRKEDDGAVGIDSDTSVAARLSNRDLIVFNCTLDKVRSVVGWTRSDGDFSLCDLSTFDLCDFLLLAEFVAECLFFCPFAGWPLLGCSLVDRNRIELSLCFDLGGLPVDEIIKYQGSHKQTRSPYKDRGRGGDGEIHPLRFFAVYSKNLLNFSRHFPSLTELLVHPVQK